MNKLICPKCQSNNIRVQQNYYWCDDCHNSSETTEVKKNKKMNKKLFEELLEIDNQNDLKDLGVTCILVTYKQPFFRNLLSIPFKRFRDIKSFDLADWIIFRDGILEILYYKGLCKIQFIR